MPPVLAILPPQNYPVLMPPPVLPYLFVQAFSCQYLIQLLAGSGNLIAKAVQDVHSQDRKVLGVGLNYAGVVYLRCHLIAPPGVKLERVFYPSFDFSSSLSLALSRVA